MKKRILLFIFSSTITLISHAQHPNKSPDAISRNNQIQDSITVNKAESDYAYKKSSHVSKAYKQQRSSDSTAVEHSRDAGNNPGPSGNEVYDVDGVVNGKLDGTKPAKHSKSNTREPAP